MKKMQVDAAKNRLKSAMVSAVCGLLIATAATVAKEPETPAGPPAGTSDKPTLYIIGYAHLDTQWRWSYPQVIAEFLHHTMEDNYRLFEKYPHYTFNFTGANRYIMMKEYFPEDYAKLKGYIQAGRWFPAGSSMEEGDVNMPDGEAIIRQVLYGNEYFRREFGVASEEYMLPDCFGFQASLPSLLAHCRLKGFSTQKLTWGSAVGIPFNVGVWTGPDGKGIVSALNCGKYDAALNSDQSSDKRWVKRVEDDGKKSGVYIDYRYYGVGDRGGAPNEASVQWEERSVTGKGPLKVIAGPADQMFKELTPAQVSKLPRYKGDLLLTNHSCGSLSSQAFVKRTNRKLEVIANAAERAAVAADWLGASRYPREKLFNAWTLQLGAHFHDTMAGTALPRSYEYTWNNMVLALNQFAAVAQDSVGAVAASMDTSGEGVPIVVYNTLSTERTDVAEATLPAVPDQFTIVGPDDKPVPFQVVSKDDTGTKVLFLARTPSISFSIYHARSAGPAAPVEAALKVTDHTLENSRFKVTLDAAGDIASIMDKSAGKEVLSAPARLAFLYENPKQYPAWNMDYEDRMRAPLGYVDGPCTFKVIENGPVRVAIQTTRQARGSTITQTIRLSAGAAGDRVEVVNHVDWQTREASLEAVFPMTVSNPNATYESQSAAVPRGNNTEVKFEVPQQQWFDLTATNGNFGTAIVNDCKYGSDKPDDKTVRLTLLYTPGVQGGYQDQGTQDLGRHEFVYAIAPHNSGWQAGKVPAIAQRVNEPLLTFNSTSHTGSLGKTISIAKTSKANVGITALKKAEDDDEIIVRLHETDGVLADGTAVTFNQPIVSAREVDGQERAMGPAKIVDGKLVTDMTPFALRAFAVKLAAPSAPAALPVSTAVDLAYDLDAVSTHANLADGSFDENGHSYPAEALPAKISSEGIDFTMGPTQDGKANALVCKGQTIKLPPGSAKVYLLAAAVDGDAPAAFRVGNNDIHQTVQDWGGYIGQWDNRIWQGVVPELTYNWSNKFVGLLPGYIKRDTVAWFSSHRHDPEKGNEYYKFSYLFKYGFDLPNGADSITLPDNPKIRVFAMTAVKSPHDQATPAMPLYDTLADHQYTSPVISPAAGTFNTSVWCTLDRSLYGRGGDIHYTLDGTEPTTSSPVFSRPVFLGDSTTVRARMFARGQGVGPETTAKYEIHDTTAPTVTAASAVSIVPSMTVHFSKPVRKESAENTANYKLEPAIEVTAAQLGDDGQTVYLTLAKPAAAGGSLHLQAASVQDTTPGANKVEAKPVAVTVVAPVFSVDDFQADGKTSKEFNAAGVPEKGKTPWTMNFFVRTPAEPESRTIIAGFGTNEDKSNGQGRFICKFDEGIHYWSRNQDVDGSALPTNAWQMVTAVYDGSNVHLYQDGKLISEQAVDLADDQPTVHLAPTDAWEHTRRFKGDINQFTIWPAALSATEVKQLMEKMPK